MSGNSTSRSVARRLGAMVAFAALAVAACSSAPGDGEATDTTEAPSSPTTASLPDYEIEALAYPDAPDDASFPTGMGDDATDVPIGTYGFSRYVWAQGADGAYRSLVEGPRGPQVRCQDEELPCSYEDLKALYESGDPIPAALELSPDELEVLVGQLDALNAMLVGLGGPDGVCAAGYTHVGSHQTPNMGIHMTNFAYNEFVPDQPQMILLAAEDGIGIPQNEIGGCEDGRWIGPEGMEIVGAAYNVPITPDHPDGFAGKLDNWHVHYNVCVGATSSGPSGCEEKGGVLLEKQPTWMVHAYVAPGFDNQSGVFAMWNESIWPIGSNAARFSPNELTSASNGQILSPINNFTFGSIEIGAGEALTFTNSDSVPHTVTGGLPAAPSGEFDSGVFGPGEVFTQTFDTAGEYEIFCTLHPSMTGTVVVVD